MTGSAGIAAASAAISDVGTVRAVNEDACLERALPPLAGIWAVADGAGGHDAGDVASRMVIEALEDVPTPRNLSELIDGAEARLLGVNEYLCELAAESEEIAFIGSTVAALLSFRRQSVCLWAGDSRVYLWRDGEFKSLTRDHSEVEELIGAGQLRREDAEDHASANIITRAVGADDYLELETRFQAVQDGDRYLLCSDGLFKALREPEIATLVSSGTPDEACARLVGEARDRACTDNVTVIVVDFDEARA
jgi:serine/threonine protein phosphatase PrpC